MKKILLVLQREYLTRIRKPSFWLLTLLVPVMMVVLYALPFLSAMKPAEHSQVVVVDDTGLFTGAFRSNSDVAYRHAGSLAHAEHLLATADSIDAIVYIPARTTTIPTDAFLYYRSDTPSPTLQGDVDNQLQTILRNRVLLDVHGITADDYQQLTTTRIRLHTQDLVTGRSGFLKVKLVIGGLLALLIVLAVSLFGSQVMRSVMEEKSSRMVEVIVSSVKPFYLMVGKIVGAGMAGLTQFVLWVLLATVGIVGIQSSYSELFHQAKARQGITAIATKGDAATAQMEALQQEPQILEVLQGIAAIDFTLLVAMFLFYFLFGYLLYASLFAMVGSLIDADTDTQQFTLPLVLLLIVPLLLLPAYLDNPSGTLATWLSIIPFTSPVAMMFRIPFGVPVWHVVLSMASIVATFPLCAWVASKVYRKALLRYGQKTTYRDLLKMLRRG